MIGTATERRFNATSALERPMFWPYAIAAAIVCPFLLGLAFPKTTLPWFAFVALAPLFLVWSKATWTQALWSGWLTGTVMFAVLFQWMTTTIGDFVGGWSILALVLLAAMEGLSVAAAAVLAALVCRGSFRAIAVVAIPAAWLLVESIRTRGALGVPFGALGLVAAHLPWLLPVAAYAGVYGLSMIVALVNAAVAALFAGTRGAKITAAACIIMVAALVAAGDLAQSRIALPPPQVKVAIAQGNISQRVKWSPQIFDRTLVTYAELTRQAAHRGARLVVWPETAITSTPLQNPLLLATLTQLASSSGVWIIAGTIDRPLPNGYYNAAIDLSPRGTLEGVYHKRWLVPFAEYLPLDAILRPLPLMDNISHFSSGSGPRLLPAAGLQWGTLICYESAFASYARQTVNSGADALIVATDDAWFGQSGGPFQHADAAVVDAVQTGRWVVRGADTGISQIIDPKGKIVASLPLDSKGVLVGLIGRGTQTPYDRFGVFWLLLLCALALIAGLIRRTEEAPGWRSRRGRS
ncbi:MAG: apolipoprotein N-acyltransferase [Candidatus Eremiobacter antarcticus]|nr:apolipoprotein N-acyltransferase [Candidatus Eremiobacteraeota bacterium]MBC5808336.1 apolipoprotein N-acyltransferase [Candidatus Eremiobacteraeota bacterium]PZR63704.1 MAG: apolipoprotein N-acyltransferase [Candidatus Eremiobacter sp. RRmetagenome_bin22]